MSLFKKSRDEEEDEEVYIDEEDVDEEDAEEDSVVDEEEEEEYEDEEPGKGRVMKIVIGLCVVLIVALAAVMFLRSHNKKSAAENEAPLYTVIEETEETGSGPAGDAEKEDAPGATETVKPQQTPGQEKPSAPAATSAPKAETLPAPADASKPDSAAAPASASASKTWDIDKDLVVYECILDWDNPTMYHISFAEFDAAGNLGKTYAFKDKISPSQMGGEFSNDSPLPGWFYPGAHVHVKANFDLSECIVTKAAA